jgi:hypothetical protein
MYSDIIYRGFNVIVLLADSRYQELANNQSHVEESPSGVERLIGGSCFSPRCAKANLPVEVRIIPYSREKPIRNQIRFFMGFVF